MDAQHAINSCTCQATSAKAVLTSRRTGRSVPSHVLAQMDNPKRYEIVCSFCMHEIFLYSYALKNQSQHSASILVFSYALKNQSQHSASLHICVLICTQKSIATLCLHTFVLMCTHVVHTESFLFSLEAKVECTFADKKVLRNVSA